MRRLLICACLLSSACSGDATGPEACLVPKACAVGGPDLAVVQVVADAEESWMGRIAHADGFDVVVEVLNRGNRRTRAANVQVEAWTASAFADVPSLAPGERAQVRVQLAYTRTYLVHGQDPGAITPVARILHEGDVRAANDTLSGDEFVTDLPVFDLAPVPWGVQSARVGGTVRLGAWIGRRIAPEPSSVTVDAMFCVLDADRGCTLSSWGALMVWQSVPGFGTSNYSGQASLQPGGLPPAPGTYRLAVCIVPSSDDGITPRRDPANPDHKCVDSGVLQLLP